MLAVSSFQLLAGTQKPVKPPALFHKPLSDTKGYAQMNNGNMQHFAVLDPSTKLCGMAMSVKTGHLDDPENYPGLAHFTEHGIFLGSYWFPGPSSFAEFVTKHGGSYNAEVSADTTLYFAQVVCEFFDEGLDRFLNLFERPLFKEPDLLKELKTIDSEREIQSDSASARIHTAFLSLLPKPLKNMSQEKLETLGSPGIADVMKKWFKNNYCKDRYNLVTYTPFKSIYRGYDRVQSIGFPTKCAARPKKEPVDISAIQGKIIRIAAPAIADAVLWIVMPYVEKASYADSQPLTYINTVVPFSGQFGLRETLETKGWISDMGLFVDKTDVSSFLVLSLNLTPEGLKQKDGVIQDVFDFFEQMRQEGVYEGLYADIQRVGQAMFDAPSDTILSPMDFSRHVAETLAHGIHYSEVFTAANLIKKMDKNDVKEVMENMRQSKSLIALYEPGLKGENLLKLETFDLQFTVEDYKFPGHHTALKFFVLQFINYMPKEVTKITKKRPSSWKDFESVPVTKFLNSKNLQVWHKSSFQFPDSPRVSLILAVKFTPLKDSAYVTLLHFAVRRLITEFNTKAVQFLLIGNSADFETDVNGLEIKVRCWRLWVLEFVELLLETLDLVDIEVPEDQVVAEPINPSIPQMSKFSSNPDDLLNQADVILNTIAGDVFIQSQSGDEKVAHGLKIKRSFSHAPMTVYTAGDLKESDLFQLINTFVYNRKLAREDVKQESLPASPKVIAYTKDIEFQGINQDVVNSKNTVFLIRLPLITAACRDAESHVYMSILTTLLESAAFNRLRTELSLGYQVLVKRQLFPDLNGYPYISLGVQGNNVSPNLMHLRVEELFVNFGKSLKTMSDLNLTKVVNSKKASYSQLPRTFREEVESFWEPIQDGSLYFNRRAEYLKVIDTSLSTPKDIRAALEATWKRLMETKSIIVKVFQKDSFDETLKTEDLGVDKEVVAVWEDKRKRSVIVKNVEKSVADPELSPYKIVLADCGSNYWKKDAKEKDDEDRKFFASWKIPHATATTSSPAMATSAAKPTETPKRHTDRFRLSATRAFYQPRPMSSNQEFTTQPVTEPVTERLTEPVTELVTERFTEAFTEPVTEPVTDPVIPTHSIPEYPATTPSPNHPTFYPGRRPSEFLP
jgi:secreted Zn-dependent insulinase-like peptidase